MIKLKSHQHLVEAREYVAISDLQLNLLINEISGI